MACKNSPCNGCTERKVEPNCHNADICAKWGEWKSYQMSEANSRHKALATEGALVDMAKQRYIKGRRSKWKRK